MYLRNQRLVSCFSYFRRNLISTRWFICVQLLNITKVLGCQRNKEMGLRYSKVLDLKHSNMADFKRNKMVAIETKKCIEPEPRQFNPLCFLCSKTNMESFCKSLNEYSGAGTFCFQLQIFLCHVTLKCALFDVLHKLHKVSLSLSLSLSL
jgi:hypothetical protein